MAKDPCPKAQQLAQVRWPACLRLQPPVCVFLRDELVRVHLMMAKDPCCTAQWLAQEHACTTFWAARVHVFVLVA
eukprot:1154741-Pelagomonas_calceolata.AAC.3